ncbi:Hypothetical predicted protein, partial [Podarcis lilfordi]
MGRSRAKTPESPDAVEEKANVSNPCIVLLFIHIVSLTCLCNQNVKKQHG